MNKNFVKISNMLRKHKIYIHKINKPNIKNIWILIRKSLIKVYPKEKIDYVQANVQWNDSNIYIN